MSTKRRGHVRQRGDTYTAYWRARNADGVSVQRSKGGLPNARAAERHLTRVLRELDVGTYVEPEKRARTQTLARFVHDDWLPAVKGSLRASTLAGYREKLTLHVLPHLGALRLAQITPDRLNALYGELLQSGRRDGRGGLSTQSVRHVHRAIYGCLADAVKWDRIARNPAQRAEPPKPKRAAMKVWSAEQLRTYLHHVRDDRLRAAWLLLVTTGMRRGEVLGLRWLDVDMDAGQLSVRQTLIAVGYRVEISEPKTERSRRRIGLDPATVAGLRSWRARQAEERLAWGEAWTESGLVFTREDGTAIHPQSLSRFFEKRAKAAGLPSIPLHALRHSYATAALKAGVPTKIISERLGHSNISTTADLYQHVLPELDDEAAARVAAAIFGA
jgi:integrase